MRTFGTDPEFFVKDENTLEFTSIIGRCGGTKDEPLQLGDVGTIQEDGVAVELGFKPVRSYKQFITSYNSIREAAQQHLKDRGLVISDDVCSVNFKSEELNDPLAWESGCDPDVDAWLLKKNHSLKYEDNVRYVGGHLHIGLPNMSLEDKVYLTRKLDLFLAVPSILEDKDFSRRKVYGTAGRFRDKPYGLEYRSLSNFWLRTPQYIEWVLRQADAARNSNINVDDLSDRIRNTVYHSDEDEAIKLMKEYKIKGFVYAK